MEFINDHKLTEKYLSGMNITDEAILRGMIVRSVGEEIESGVFSILNNAAEKINLSADMIEHFNAEERIKLLLNYSHFRVSARIQHNKILSYIVSKRNDRMINLINLPHDYIRIMQYFPPHSQQISRDDLDAITFLEITILGIFYEVVTPTKFDYYHDVLNPIGLFYPNNEKSREYVVDRPHSIQTIFQAGKPHAFSFRYEPSLVYKKYLYNFLSKNYYISWAYRFVYFNKIGGIEVLFKNITLYFDDIKVKWQGERIKIESSGKQSRRKDFIDDEINIVLTVQIGTKVALFVSASESVSVSASGSNDVYTAHFVTIDGTKTEIVNTSMKLSKIVAKHSDVQSFSEELLDILSLFTILPPLL